MHPWEVLTTARNGQVRFTVATTNAATTNDANRTVAWVIGAIFVVVGILGFIPGITQNGELLGIFGVNALHNWVHILSGAALLAGAAINHGEHARMANLVVGGTYALVTLLGFIAPGFLAGLLNQDNSFLAPDNFLHLVLTLVLLGVALTVRNEVRRPVAGTRY